MTHKMHFLLYVVLQKEGLAQAQFDHPTLQVSPTMESLAWLCRFANVKNIVGVNGYRYISHLESSILLDVW